MKLYRCAYCRRTFQADMIVHDTAAGSGSSSTAPLGYTLQWVAECPHCGEKVSLV